MSTPHCTLCWPSTVSTSSSDITDNSNKGKPGTETSSLTTTPFVVGWNPRGFVVVVADVVHAASVSDAQQKLDLVVNEDAGKLKGLRVVGCLVSGGASSSSSSGPSSSSSTAAGGSSISSVSNNNINPGTAAEMDQTGIKLMRQKADIWIELDQATGRTLLNLFCCGYKYNSSQLQVIEHAGNHANFRNYPRNLNVISGLGLGNIAKLRHGEMPKPMHPEDIEHTVSRLEESLLPAHCRQMYKKPPSTNADKNKSVDNFENTSLSESPQKDRSARRSSLEGAGLSNNNNTSSLGGFGGHNDSFNDNESVVSNASRVGGGSMHGSSADILEVPLPVLEAAKHFTRDTCPPRLDFPNSSHNTEFAILLGKINAGLSVRRILAHLSSHKGDTKVPSSILAPSDGDPSLATISMLSGPAAVLLSATYTFLEIVAIPLLSLCSRFLYTARLGEGRVRETMNAIGLLQGKSHSCGLHPVIPYLWEGTSRLQRRISLMNFAISNLADILIGWLVCYLLLSYEEAIFDICRYSGHYGLFSLHYGYFEWFLGWPGGFKMNEALNQLLGAISFLVLDIWQGLADSVTSYFWQPLSVGYLACQISSLFGVSCFFGVLADATNISTLHLRNLAHVFGLLYRGCRAVLGSLSLQFRGKRFNPLRNRIDEGDFSVDQVLLGTLVGTMLLFLFPTVALYYFYLTIVRTSVWVVQEGMQGCSLLSSRLPVGYLVAWFLYRNDLTSGVSLQVDGYCGGNSGVGNQGDQQGSTSSSSGGGSSSSPTSKGPKFPSTAAPGAVILRLTTKSLPLASVFAEFLFVLTCVLSALRPQRLINFILVAKEKPMLDPKKAIYPHLVRSTSSPEVKLPLKTFELS